MNKKIIFKVINQLENKNKLYFIFIVTFFCNLSLIIILYNLNILIGSIFNYLQEYNLSNFLYSLLKFFIFILCFVILIASEYHLKNILQVRLRFELTNFFLKKWLISGWYYNHNFTNEQSDAEQKINDDIRDYVAISLNLFFDSLYYILNIFIFSMVLWKISQPITILHIHIHGYLFWSVLLYVIIGMIFTMLLGKPLSKLNQQQRQLESIFRANINRIKEHNESIRSYQGENFEFNNAMFNYKSITKNIFAIGVAQTKLRIFRSGYNQIGFIIPLLIVSPLFFAKEIMFGAVMQVNAACEQIKLSLFYFLEAVNNIMLINGLHERLSDFASFIELANSKPNQINIEYTKHRIFSIKNYSINLPNNNTIINNLSLNLIKGDRLIIDGNSGSGKSTILKSLFGIWPFSKGNLLIEKNAKLLFIAQKPYLPTGSLKSIISYPQTDKISDDTIIDLMKQCKIDHLINKLHDYEKWDKILSLGEQQRIAICRALLSDAGVLFFDEITSALDKETELTIYQLLIKKFCNSIIISISHSPQIKKLHNKSILL